MDACGMIEAEILEDVKRSTLNQLTDWTIEADKMLVF
jgi:sulfur relay (sulfurtransferase) complex TusBCD TusD component (DsrE family)